MSEFISGLYFSVFVLAVIALFDVLIKFKRPVFLKTLISVIVVNNILTALGNICYPQYFFIYMVLIRSINSTAAISFIHYLYFPRLKNLTYIFSGLVAVFLIYFLYVNSHIIEGLLTGTLNSINNKNVIIPNQFFVFRLFLMLIFITGAVNIIRGLKKRRHENIYFEKMSNWTIANLVFFIVIPITYIPFKFYQTYPESNRLISALINICAMLLILYRPNFLNNHTLRFTLSKYDVKDFRNDQIEKFLFEFYTNFYYLNKDASLEDFAEKIEIDKNDLYRFVYDKYLMSFGDLVNKNRVEYFLELISKKRFTSHTIEDLAVQAGFNSRQHLYKPFKKFHGGSPTDLIDSRN